MMSYAPIHATLKLGQQHRKVHVRWINLQASFNHRTKDTIIRFVEFLLQKMPIQPNAASVGKSSLPGVKPKYTAPPDPPVIAPPHVENHIELPQALEFTTLGDVEQRIIGNAISIIKMSSTLGAS